MINRPGLEQFDRSGATDGQVPLWNDTDDVWEPGDLPASGVQSIIPGAYVEVDDADPANPVVSAIVLEPLTTEIGGVPDLVWDDNNKLVMTEAT